MATALSWSGGKDCAWALGALRASGADVTALVTTVRADTRRVAMHEVSAELIELQAAAAGVQLWTVPLPWPCPNVEYEVRMAALCARAREAGIRQIAFGDLFLRDVREYRERALQGTGLEAVFPLWGLDTGALARQMIAGGLKARVAAVDTRALGAAFAGREYDTAFLRDLPPGVDPCGENGEFHSFVYDGPMLAHPVPLSAGAVREDGGYAWADLSS